MHRLSFVSLIPVLSVSLLGSLLIGLSGCGDDEGCPAGRVLVGGVCVAPDDAGSDGDLPDVVQCDASTLAAFETGDADGHAEPLGSSATEARAGKISEAELPVHPDGLLTWTGGDFVLANDRIAVVIEGTGRSELYDPYGGKIVGISRVEAGVMVDPADYNELIVGVGRFTVQDESVTVMNDGSDGEAAVVRLVGALQPVPFIDGLGRLLAPDDYTGIEVAVDYTLAPAAEHITVTYNFRNPLGNRGVSLPMVLFFQKYRMPDFAPVIGFGDKNQFGEENPGGFPYIAFADDDGASYAWRSPDGPINLFIEISGTLAFSAPRYTIDGCSMFTKEVGELHVGGPGIDGLVAAIARTDGETLRTITGTVTKAGVAQSNVRVHAESADGSAYLTRTLTGDDGTFTVTVPTEDVRLTAFRRGDALGAPVAVTAATGTMDLTLAPTGLIIVNTVDGEGAGSPARIQVVPTTPQVIPATFGEPAVVSGRMHVEHSLTGAADLTVPPGEYMVYASRGFEYEMDSAVMTVTAGGERPAPFNAVLGRVVDTTGVMCADFHIHTFRSPDSPDNAELKLRSAIADGLEIPVRSDHEWVADFEPVIAGLPGSELYAYGVGALELTTFEWGHFGVFPLDPIDSMPNDGAFDWAFKLPPEVFGEVRAREGTFGSPNLIINHPRSNGGLGAAGAYFDAAEYDPTSGLVGKMELWDEAFTLVEVFNDSDFDENFPAEGNSTVKDWFSFLNAGRRVFAIGSSDSHSVSTSPVGYPRTCIPLGTDSPVELRGMGAAVISDAVNAGSHTISGGIYVDVLAGDGVGPGSDVTGVGAMAPVRVRVQAAPWVSADRLRMYVDGEMVTDIPIDDTMDPIVRFDAELIVPVADTGSWVVFVASGAEDLSPVYPGRNPFGVTNPIFFTR